MKKYTHRILTLAGLVTLSLGLYACVTTVSMPKTHPVEVPKPPLCSACHTGEQISFDHTDDFAKSRHGLQAARRSQVCDLCHRQAFCADCHAGKEEIKPSDKLKDNPARISPHRGDYLSRHRIDGRIDPVSCLKCHGRTNNARCKACHR